jgi:hypothetical protein
MSLYCARSASAESRLDGCQTPSIRPIGFLEPDCRSGLRRKVAKKAVSPTPQAILSGSVQRQELQNCGRFLGFPPHGMTPSLLLRLYGGGRGIRTPGTLSRTAVFKMYPSPPPHSYSTSYVHRMQPNSGSRPLSRQRRTCRFPVFHRSDDGRHACVARVFSTSHQEAQITCIAGATR